jgi:hypothetical protein
MISRFRILIDFDSFVLAFSLAFRVFLDLILTRTGFSCSSYYFS